MGAGCSSSSWLKNDTFLVDAKGGGLMTLRFFSLPLATAKIFSIGVLQSSVDMGFTSMFFVFDLITLCLSV